MRKRTAVSSFEKLNGDNLVKFGLVEPIELISCLNSFFWPKDMLSYRCSPLDCHDFIRLLLLHPALDDGCTRYSLSEALPDYEAISYTWGDSSKQVSIQFKKGRQELQVNRNCYDALRRLRRRDTDRLVWMDAICT
jgi:hypothetical protein